MRSGPLAFASIITTLALSSGESPFGARGSPLLALAGSAPKHVAQVRAALAPTTARVNTLGPAALRFGRSIGSPTDGRLIGGMRLEEGPALRVVPAYAAGDVRWGLEPLIAMIDRAARGLRRKYPECVLSVGHLSRAGGGDIDRHRSHESGRDADVSFFARSASGRQLLATRFVTFRGDGSAVDWPGARFDDEKNWALVAAMVSDPQAHVTHLFVAAPLRARLLSYAERVGAPTALRLHAAELMQQPRGVLPHDDHFHVRIGCPAKMSGCVENPAVRAGSPAGSTLADTSPPACSSEARERTETQRCAPSPRSGLRTGGRRGPVEGWVTMAPDRVRSLASPEPAAPGPKRPVSPLPAGLPSSAPAGEPALEPPTEDAPPERDDPPVVPRLHGAPAIAKPAPLDDVDG